MTKNLRKKKYKKMEEENIRMNEKKDSEYPNPRTMQNDKQESPEIL